MVGGASVLGLPRCHCEWCRGLFFYGLNFKASLDPFQSQGAVGGGAVGVQVDKGNFHFVFPPCLVGVLFWGFVFHGLMIAWFNHVRKMVFCTRFNHAFCAFRAWFNHVPCDTI